MARNSLISVHGQWAIVKDGLVVFGEDDFPRKGRRFFNRKTPPRDPEARQRWKRANQFFDAVKSEQLMVTAAIVTPEVNLRIEFTEGHCLLTLAAYASMVENWVLTDQESDQSWYVYTDSIWHNYRLSS
ncbi:MAG: hypothetical protein JNK63_04785 [Chthonomonas sp.]|nr:hypothetical protein [Chthonomonas sp.]